MKFKHIVFKDGQVVWNNSRGLCIPADVVALFLNLVEISPGEKHRELLFEIGKSSSQNLILNKTKPKHVLVMDYINSMGFGNFDLTFYNQNKKLAYVKSKNNAVPKSYKKIFGLRKESLDIYLAGVLAGVFSKLFECEVDCYEETCTSQGKPYCLFKIKSKK